MPQVMQMYSMARRLEGSNVSVTSLHPGFVNTELMSNFSSSFTGAVVRVINRFSKDILLNRKLFLCDMKMSNVVSRAKYVNWVLSVQRY